MLFRSKNVAAGANPMQLKKGIEKGVAAAVEHIGKQARDIEGHGEIVVNGAPVAVDHPGAHPIAGPVPRAAGSA